MARITAFLSVLLLSLLSIVSAPDKQQVGLMLIGGDYTLQGDEIRHGNMIALFSAVTLEEGSIIEGNLLALGGSVSVNGLITENITSLSSDLIIQSAAQITGEIKQLGKIPLEIELPSILLIIS